jgi:hypothetical protein
VVPPSPSTGKVGFVETVRLDARQVTDLRGVKPTLALLRAVGKTNTIKKLPKNSRRVLKKIHPRRAGLGGRRRVTRL